MQTNPRIITVQVFSHTNTDACGLEKSFNFCILLVVCTRYIEQTWSTNYLFTP